MLTNEAWPNAWLHDSRMDFIPRCKRVSRPRRSFSSSKLAQVVGRLSQQEKGLVGYPVPFLTARARREIAAHEPLTGIGGFTFLSLTFLSRLPGRARCFPCASTPVPAPSLQFGQTGVPLGPTSLTSISRQCWISLRYCSRSAVARPEYRPCLVTALRMRSIPSGVFAPVLSPP